MRHNDSGFWDTATEAQLSKMWNDDGLSAAQIAKAFGFKVSRNAVIGKAHRMKLAARKAPTPRYPTLGRR